MRQILAMILFLASGPAFAEVEDFGAARLEYGYLCTPSATSAQDADDTASGTITEFDFHPEIKFHRTQIPAILGVSFGAHIQPKPDYAGSVTIVVTHPPLGSKGLTRESWPAELPSDQYLYVGYGLSETWELVTGAWSMSAISQGREIFRIAFDLVDPSVLAEGTPVCDLNGGNS